MYNKYNTNRTSRFATSVQDRLNRLRSSARPGVQSAIKNTPEIKSKIIKDLGNGKVSIMGNTYDKKLVSEKMKEVDTILKTMSLPEIKKKFGI